MMFCRWQIFAVIYLSLPQVSIGEERDLHELIQRLGDASRKERYAAEQQLIERGPEVLPQLQPHLTTDDVAIREALRRVRDTIAHQQAERALQATRVSFSRSGTLAELAEELSRQSGNLVTVAPDLSRRRVSVQFENMLFWDAVQELAIEAQAGWEWKRQAEGIDLAREPVHSRYAIDISQQARHRTGTTTISGPCLINATAERRSRGFAKSRPQRIHFRVDVEPHVTPYFVMVPEQTFQLISGEDVAKSFTPDATREYPFYGAQTLEFQVDLVADDPITQGRLQGQLVFMAGVDSETLMFPLQTAPHVELAGSSRIQLVQVTRPKPERLQVDLLAELTLPAGEFTSHRLGMLHQQAWLRTAIDELAPDDIQLVQVDEAGHHLRYLFNTAAPLETLTFAYRFPKYVALRNLPFVMQEFSIDR